MEPFKIGFFGHDPWSHTVFNKIVEDKSLSIQFVTPRFKEEDLELKALAVNHEIDYIKHPNVNSVEYLDLIKKYNCDLMINMAFDQIYRNDIIHLAPHKLVNCHISKLPFYRGRNALNWVLINDEKEFGLTVHFVDEGIDTGDIILQRLYPITDEDDFQSVLDVAFDQCSIITYDAIKMIQHGKIKQVTPQKMIHPTGFYCGKIEDGDEWIHWGKTSREIFNFVRGMAKPWTMAQSKINDKIIKINKVALVKEVPSYKCILGQVVGIEGKKFYVKTGDTIVKVVEYEYEGKVRIGDRLLI